MNENQPQQAKTFRGTYTYFRYDLTHLLNTNFTISVTPVDGDPDIYVSSKIAQPTKDNFEQSSSLYGFDLVVVQHTAQSVPGLAYYIGVYAFTDCHYTIAIRTAEQALRVVEGHALSDMVENGEMNYYVYHNLKKQRILVSVLPLASAGGDPDLFIQFNSYPTTKSGGYLYHSETLGDDAIEIEKDDSLEGLYYIGIYGYARDTKYQLLITTEEANTVLADGVAVPSSLLAGEINYYKFNHGDYDVSIVATVTVFRGTVNLYSAMHSRPSANDKVGNVEGGQITLAYHAPTQTGVYYYSVVASSNADYTITVTTQQVPTTLRDGSAIYWNNVPQGYYRHYIFDAEKFSTSDVSITVNPWLGDVDIYVSTEPFPVKSNSTWSSDSWGEDTVVIHANDPKANGKTRFYVSVYGFRETNYYSILAMQSGTSIRLLDDVTVPGTVAHKGYVFYSYNLATYTTITVSLHIQGGAGNANIYYSRTHPKPNSEDHDGKSLNFGDDILTVEGAPPGIVYFSVYGAYGPADGAPITYTINVKTNYQHLYANGQAYFVSVAKGQYSQFRAYVGSHVKTLVASATLVSGATTLFAANDDSPANNTHYTYMNGEWPGNALMIQSTATDFKTGYWYFSVYGSVASDFYISLNAYPYGGWLKQGVPVISKAPTDGTPVMFSFWVPVTADDEKDDYVLYIRAMSGNTYIYANQDYTVDPSPTNYVWASNGSVDRMLVFPKTSLSFRKAIYLSIYGDNNGGAAPTFELLMGTASSPRFVGQDQPQSVVVNAGQYSYFTALNRAALNKITVSVESCIAGPAPKVYLSSTHWKPNATSPDTLSSSSYTAYPNDWVQTVSTDSYAEEKFFIGVGGGDSGAISSLYITTGDSSRPTVSDGTLHGQDMTSKGETVVTFKTATPSARFVLLITYSAYIHKLDTGSDPTIVNMQTVCGIEKHGEKVVTSASPAITGEQVEFKFTVDKNSKYLLNILAHDSNGLATPYKAAYIINGRVVYEESGANVAGIIFGLLFAFIALALIGYIGGGMGYKAYKGHRGIEMIPNIDFWRMVFTCGRSSSQYSEFDNDRVNTSGFGSTNRAEESQPITGGGYGSI